MWNAEHVRVYQQPHFVSIEGGEHLAYSWDPDLPLVEHTLFFSEEDAVGDGCVGVSVWLVVEADHIALGDEVEEDWGEEGEKSDDSTESGRQGKALDHQSGLQEGVWHQEEAGPTGAV